MIGQSMRKTLKRIKKKLKMSLSKFKITEVSLVKKPLNDLNQ